MTVSKHLSGLLMVALNQQNELPSVFRLLAALHGHKSDMVLLHFKNITYALESVHNVVLVLKAAFSFKT